MTKLDDELTALLKPLGIVVEQPAAPVPIHVEFLGERVLYDFTIICVYQGMTPHRLTGTWHGSTRLVEADAAESMTMGPSLEGIRIAPCTPQVERALATRQFPWCAYPEQNIVLVALPRSAVVPLLLY